MNDMYINSSKSWLPQRGGTQLAFLDNEGNVTNFFIRGRDTTVVNTTECGETYNYQYITATLYLNTAATDSIYFNLFNRSNLEARAASDGSYNYSMIDVFGKAKKGVQAKYLSAFVVGSKTYKEVIVVFRFNPFPDTVDSVMLANNVGIVGFKYYGRKYSLR